MNANEAKAKQRTIDALLEAKAGSPQYVGAVERLKRQVELLDQSLAQAKERIKSLEGSLETERRERRRLVAKLLEDTLLGIFESATAEVTERKLKEINE